MERETVKKPAFSCGETSGIRIFFDLIIIEGLISYFVSKRRENMTSLKQSKIEFYPINRMDYEESRISKNRGFTTGLTVSQFLSGMLRSRRQRYSKQPSCPTCRAASCISFNLAGAGFESR
jgi:hypothetical protein